MRLYSMMKDFIEYQDYIDIDFFAQKYKVSKRTIQNDISYLTRISSDKGFQLDMKRNKGYLIEIVDQKSMDKFLDELSKIKSFNAKQRIEYMLAYLAIQKDYVSMEQIAGYFDISKTSVKKDMKEVAKLAQNAFLKLETKSHYGVRLEKNNTSYLNYIKDCYFSNNSIVRDAIESEIGDFKSFHQKLIKEFINESVNINYNELNELLVWLMALSYYKLIEHDEKIEDYIVTDDNSISRIASNIKDWMEAVYDIKLSKKDFEEVKKHIHTNARLKKMNINIKQNLEKDIDIFLQDVDQSEGTDFSKDGKLKEALLSHGTLLIERLHDKISYKNPLVDKLSVIYPSIFNMAIRFSEMLHHNYHVKVTHDEAGFIATHFLGHIEHERQRKMMRFNKIAVICSTGGGNAYIIKMQIGSIFNKANIQSFSFLELNNVDIFDPDLIFTIVPLNKQFDAPVIQIKELLDDEDLIRIRKFLQYDNLESFSISELPSTVNNLFKREFFKVSESNDYIDLITTMANELEEKGYGEEGYCKNILERQQYMSTIYFNGVSIPHPIEINAIKDVVSVCILKEPINYQDKEVRIVFMVALTKEKYEIHKDITKILYNLMKDSLKLSRILDSKKFEELMIVLKELEGSSV